MQRMREAGATVRRMLEQSAAALGRDDPSFFSSHLKQGDSWRLFPHFREHAGYLDIETTGLGPACEITTIALYDGDRVRTYVNGVNLDDCARASRSAGMRAKAPSSTSITRSRSSGHSALTKCGSIPSMPQVLQPCS